MLHQYARRLFLVSLFFLGCSLPSAHADLKRPEESLDKDKKKDKDAPVMERAPVPESVKLTVNRGETVEITLSALTASNKDVIFILRNEPTAGKLLEPEPVRKTKTTSVIRYKSDPASKLTRDEIKFAVRVEGGSVSPAASVSINLVEIKPELVLPEKIEGGQIRCGQSTLVVVPVRNTGNGAFSQALTLPPGWRLEKGERLEVPAGKSGEMRLVYTPTTLGATQSVLNLGPKSQSLLTGTGLLPVEAPPTVTLVWDPATARRIATVPVRNALDKPLSLKLQGAIPGLEFPKEIALGAFGEGSLRFVLTAEPSLAVRQALDLTVQGLTQSLEVIAERAPAQVVITGLGAEGTLDFGNLDALKLADSKKTITLSNVGGSPVTVYSKLAESFELTGFTDGMTLQSGMEVPIQVGFKSTAVGALKNAVQFKWDQHAVNCTLVANVIPDANAKAMLPDAPTNLSGSSEEDRDPLNARDTKTIDLEMNMNRAGLLTSDFQIDPSIPEIKSNFDEKNPGVYLKAATQESLTLAWKPLPKPANGPDYDYVVLYRVIKAIHGYPRIIWVQYPKIVVTRTGDEVTALLKGIGPGWANQLRVSAKAQSGLYGQPSEPKMYGIPAAEPFDWASLTFPALFVTLGLLIYFRRRAQKKAFVPRRYAHGMEEETPI